MSGRSVEGSVRRAVDRDTNEQIVILSVTASHTTLDEIERSLLTTDAWDWITRHYENRHAFSHRQFRKLTSFSGP